MKKRTIFSKGLARREKVTNFSGGFTLIELLVVIAVIGILAAIVLAALGNARDKSKISKVQATLQSARSQAEIYRTSNNNTYHVSALNYVCLSGAPAGIFNLIDEAKNVFNPTDTVNSAIGTSQLTNNFARRSTCHVDNSGLQWAASVPLNTGTALSFWCVDSSGASKLEPAANVLAANATTCP